MTMILQVSDKWRIASDRDQWMVQRSSLRKGQTDWNAVAWFTRPDHAALWLVQNRIRDLPGTYAAADALEELAAALHTIVKDNKRITDELLRLLSSTDDCRSTNEV